MDENKVTYFAETDSRNRRVRFGIKAKDRTRHVYILGKTGMGKSTLLENMAVQDILGGEGMAIIDPHGGTARKLLEYIPQHRIKDVVFFNPADLDNPISFNVLENVDADHRHFVAAGLMNTFKKIWQDAWSARMEYILGNTLLALLEYPEATLLSVNKMLTDKDYRKTIVDNVKDPSVKAFWVDEFAKYTDKFAAEATPAIQNKIGQFTSNPLIRNLIGQPKSSFDFRQIMDEKKILIINLSKGELGPDNMRLIGGMLVTKIYLAAMSRANISATRLKEAPPFYFYVDEFQNFANESFAEILSEARKYKLALTVANQYIEQMTEEVRAAVIGNVGSMIIFRIGSTDAMILEKEFAPELIPEDLVNLGFAQCYLKLMIDGVTSRPFSATTLPPIKPLEANYRDDVIESSRKQFSKPRAFVEKSINDWYESLTNKSKKGEERKPATSSTVAYGERPRPEGIKPSSVGSNQPYKPPYQAPRPSLSFTPKSTENHPNGSSIIKPKIIETPSVVEDEKDDFAPLTKLKDEVKTVSAVSNNLEKPVAPSAINNKVTGSFSQNQTEANKHPDYVQLNNKPNFGGKKVTQQGMSDLKALLQNVMKKNEGEKKLDIKVEQKLEPVVHSRDIHQTQEKKSFTEVNPVVKDSSISNQPNKDDIRINGKPFRELKFEYGHLLAKKNGGFVDDEYNEQYKKEIPKDVLKNILHVKK